jgi:hypothetical protein
VAHEFVSEDARVSVDEVARDVASLELFDDPLRWLGEDVVAYGRGASGACFVPARRRVSVERVVHLTLPSSVPKLATDLDELGSHGRSFVGCEVQPLPLAEPVAPRLEPADRVGGGLEAVDLGDRSVFASDQRPARVRKLESTSRTVSDCLVGQGRAVAVGRSAR